MPERRDGGRPLEHTLDPRRPGGAAADASRTEAVLYRGGQRVREIPDLAELRRAAGADPAALAWADLVCPTERQVAEAADCFGLHHLAAEDAVVAHQRPKMERYGPTLFAVLRPARYAARSEEIVFGEVHLFLGADFVLTVYHGGSPDPAGPRHRLEKDPRLLALGPGAVLYAVLDTVVDGYAPVIADIREDTEEIEIQIFDQDPSVSRRIYRLARQVVDFQRAVHPLPEMLDRLMAQAEGRGELHRHLRDAADHAAAVVERVDGFGQLFHDALSVNGILVNQAQNETMRELTEAGYRQEEQMKKASSWAGILVAPTLIASVYGMNFQAMPELHWGFGYPFALALMAVVAVALYAVFKRHGWL